MILYKDLKFILKCRNYFYKIHSINKSVVFNFSESVEKNNELEKLSKLMNAGKLLK